MADSLTQKKILVIVGTRPNFIKVCRFKEVANHYENLEVRIVHTGQHYDQAMSSVFFEQFNTQPDFFLELNSSSPIVQIATAMQNLERLILNTFRPDLIIVPGDVNSTLAGALVANKMNIPLAHLESGLRSNDLTMPEEINRILTDRVSDYLFITEKSGAENIQLEKLKGKSFLIGNTMIDAINKFENEISNSNILSELKLQSDYILMTMHRPSNVDQKKDLKKIISLINYLGQKYQIVLPIHPRAKNNFNKFDLESELRQCQNLIITEPKGYFDFQALIKNCKFILTDSGGIQEEATYRHKPCLTLRPNTERPITIDIGTNILVKFTNTDIQKEIDKIESGDFKKGAIPHFWDGKSTERVFEIIMNEIFR
ncbi:MAG: UDP-N-acetylglucosamine 2-epimerase (non-hydrolyzing) [Crocinitomicaceae bacterium]|nr:UDP-N-acetylglucosamine 2-epimerase (non-hydrolyzing) [Crocinitomicaceae bacterium]MBK8926131.1 UDP-N-acetylglucosamine 2-epimerase (non-hydrolyzing) [Crocinitomicaceae bacterium]